jgi:cyanophycinase
LKSIFLLADSRLLFPQSNENLDLVKDVLQSAEVDFASVAYLGASNGDDPIFYNEIFSPAFDRVEVFARRMITAHPSAADETFLRGADIIVLAGGSVHMGWNAFEKTEVSKIIAQRYLQGAVLVGVSAGAVQLGKGALNEDKTAILRTFGVVPLYVAAHEERSDWESLRQIASLSNMPIHGVGIQSGGGLVATGTELVPICRPLFEICCDLNRSTENLIFPPLNRPAPNSKIATPKRRTIQ